MVTNKNEQNFTYDRSNELAYGNLRGLENFSPLSSYGKNSQSVSDCARYESFVCSEEELRLHSLKKENGKRPLADVSPNKVGYKRSKQLSDSDSDSDSFQGSPPSDEVTCSAPFDSSWFNLDSSTWVPVFSNYYDCQTVTRSVEVKSTCSPVCDGPFHKSVAIGPNHQADIPSCNNKDAYCCDDSDKWVADCVISLPDSKSFLNEEIECDCMDEGSIECVREHVSDARENLRRELGEDKFEKLGFCDIGEEMALKWRENEQRLFEQVVFSNPKSMDVDFWEELSNSFPNKSRGELVSYYFNVFMLRKRAAQNRFDPTHIDSDDDEWQELQNDSQIEDEEETEGSGIESSSDSDEIISNYDFITEGTSEKSFAKEEPCFDVQNDSCTSFDESVNCQNITDGFGVILDGGFFHEDFNTSDNYFTDKGRDDFTEMDNTFGEFGTENWEFGEI